MTRNRKLVHTEIIPIRWGDMDAIGHVNNTVYFRYMEQGRISWFESLGMLGARRGVGGAVINASCTFLKQLTYPGSVEVKTFVGEIGRSSVQTYVEMRPSYDSGTLYAEGAAKVIWVDYAKGRSVPLPQKLRGILGKP